MKLAILKPTVLLLLILTSFINSRTLTRIRSASNRWFWDTPKNIGSDIEVIDNPSTSVELIQNFVIGLLSTVGIVGAYETSLILGKILGNEVDKSISEDGKNYKCNKEGLFAYTKTMSHKSFTKEQKIQYSSCEKEKEKMLEAINELDDACRCATEIKLDPYHHKCDGERHDNYISWLKLNKMDKDDLYGNYFDLTNLHIESHKKYDKINCENKAVDGVISTILHKLKQGFYSIKFAIRCNPDLKLDLAVLVITTIISGIATFFSQGFYTVAKLVVIVLKMFVSIYKLIKYYTTQLDRYKYIGEIIGYIIRIGLEIAQVPILKSPLMFEKPSKLKRKIQK